MVALLVSTPEVAGAAFTSELYSPHLDVHQRMLILETLASAAQQMANPRARLPASRDQMPGVCGALEADSAAVTNATQGMLICKFRFCILRRSHEECSVCECGCIIYDCDHVLHHMIILLHMHVVCITLSCLEAE